MVENAIECVRRLLPRQAPIEIFIHHNTLHAFEHLPFEQALEEAARIYGARPYPDEDYFRLQWLSGRITEADLEHVLRAELGREADLCLVPGSPPLWQLLRLILMEPIHEGPPESISWHLYERGMLDSPQVEILWDACRCLCEEYVTSLPRRPPATPTHRHQEFLMACGGPDLDALVHPVLVRLVSAFLDQGVAYWKMPGRETGFLGCVRSLFGSGTVPGPEWLAAAPIALECGQDTPLDPMGLILTQLRALGVPVDLWKDFLCAEALALPGWTGIMARLEHDPEAGGYRGARPTLAEFLAVHLTFIRLAYVDSSFHHFGRVLSYEQLQRRLVLPALGPGSRDPLAFQLFQFLCRWGLCPEQLAELDATARLAFVSTCAKFGSLERRKIWHLAFEQHYRMRILGSVLGNRAPSLKNGNASKAQVVFCIDEREESIRRHLEEIMPDVQTLSTAGFFGLAVRYRGLDRPSQTDRCPVALHPEHEVWETPTEDHQDLAQKRSRRRHGVATALWSLGVGSRLLVRGWVSAALLGFFSFIPLTARVLAPRWTEALRRRLIRWFLPQPDTTLDFNRTSAAEDASDSGAPTDIIDGVARVLEELAPSGDFARLVVLLGHDSSSLNNPHQSAYRCGACGGHGGGPNARLFAKVVNQQLVREELRSRGIDIPMDVHFLGGCHDTCDDAIEYFDVDQIPASHRILFRDLSARLEEACAANAQERCRRFESAPLDLSPVASLVHVEGRAVDFSQPRPELGHCTNAVLIVGRREISHGLFLDRRAFLASYDPSRDPAGRILTRILGAVGPVCAGISLEYFFSFVDNQRYGAGSKLPHNVNGLVGVTDGVFGDIRTGLPWQMVEIHEPMRLLMIVESVPETLLRVLQEIPSLAVLVRHKWIQTIALDPADGRLLEFKDDGFCRLEVLPEPLAERPSSRNWYCGQRGHLRPARLSSREAA